MKIGKIFNLFNKLQLISPNVTSSTIGHQGHLGGGQRRFYRVCVVGSGPAGFYAAQQLAKGKAAVDIFEKLPVPFGLVRYGVAPDHPEIKNVIHTFTTVLSNPLVRFFGNVEVGKEISFSQLQSTYDAILLAYGSYQDQKLNIQGEKELVISGRDFVGWYNGLPEDKNLTFDLQNSKTAFIIGHGNVALDICRILLSPIKALETTDIATYALDTLRKSKIVKVVIIGRRGPLQVSFTIKELREMINLPGSSPHFNIQDFTGINETLLSTLPRPRRRITELLLKTAQSPPLKTPEDSAKSWELKFYRSPLEINQNHQNHKKSVVFGVNKLVQGSNVLDGKVEATNETENCESDLLFRSIGYKSMRIFDEVPFDEKTGIIPNVDGRVLPGVYCCGWLASGPHGVILSSMQNAFEVAKNILHDLPGQPPKKIGDLQFPGGKSVTNYEDYLKIAKYEEESKQKVSSVEEMLRIASKK